ncbi:Leucine-responsive regulatory protein [Pseudovibrio sp. W64]|uniref:DNA-binding transcriptional regulator, Lrp family n=1 Tax=Pseudovibrio ascidiaceicola TaxID=285279 RepID=A0A1I4BPJ2_9HYPH|nr:MULTISPECIES: Lrp/AsnC family transcriptional regulator [Pseudovibrio]KZK76410.1 Leucine-responsive regulatory protein [Pseudovibrio sp. W64]KZK80099.1 Leucine-responsive regulatory protein [Pseudovibrio sp. Ad46]SFK70748.1 DNA-binding transcriptional regulator, Lrp family [Pseudovibrio ascidiaceicola]
MLDATDREIIAILSKEARIPIKTLAARINLSRSATSERITRLENNGTIRGYRADIGGLDPTHISAFLFIRLSRTPMREILDILAAFPEIKRVSSVSGELDLVVEVVASSMEMLNNVRDAIASTDGVKDLTTTVILRDEFQRT